MRGPKGTCCLETRSRNRGLFGVTIWLSGTASYPFLGTSAAQRAMSALSSTCDQEVESPRRFSGHMTVWITYSQSSLLGEDRAGDFPMRYTHFADREVTG